ncbi:MAG: hypothetical protein IPH28_00440 [Cytophagaceae bacterium]|nr:hypothetical protein [Cytophagaceae bacterium]
MGNRILLSIAYIVMLGCNGLANGLPLNGKNTGELSDQYPNLFVPAGLTFSIWGVIYLLLLAFVVNVWIKKKEVSKWIIINFSQMRAGYLLGIMKYFGSRLSLC